MEPPEIPKNKKGRPFGCGTTNAKRRELRKEKQWSAMENADPSSPEHLLKHLEALEKAQKPRKAHWSNRMWAWGSLPPLLGSQAKMAFPGRWSWPQGVWKSPRIWKSPRAARIWKSPTKWIWKSPRARIWSPTAPRIWKSPRWLRKGVCVTLRSQLRVCGATPWSKMTRLWDKGIWMPLNFCLEKQMCWSYHM